MGRFDRQAASVRFALLSQGFTATEVKAYCLCRWAGLKVLHRYGNNGWACRHGKQEFILTAEQVERTTHALGWLDNVPTMPVRIARLGASRSVPADFEGVPFETFIVCDNLYQGYLATKQDELLDELASHLYSSKSNEEGVGIRDLLGRLIPPYTLHLTQTERISVFYWFASLKGISRQSVQALLSAVRQRKRRRWFSRKYYASVMRIKEFYEDNIGAAFTGILSNALNKNSEDKQKNNLKK